MGTYGMASAQLYYGRMAAILLRLCSLIFPYIDWGFVFVDDFLLASQDFDSNSGHRATVAVSGSLGLPPELAHDGTLRGQHLVGILGQSLWPSGWFSFGQEAYPGDAA